MNSKLSAGQEAMMLRFMEMTIEKMNTALSGLYALQNVLVEKGIVSERELQQRLKDAKTLPDRLVGSQTLQEMVDAYNRGSQESV